MFFMLRRLVTMVVLVFRGRGPLFQCFLLTVLSVVNMGYLLHTRPMKTKKENYLNWFNEGCILVFMYLLTNMLNIGIPKSLFYIFGFLLMAVVILNTAVNMIAIAIETLLGVWMVSRLKLIEIKVKRALSKQEEGRV